MLRLLRSGRRIDLDSRPHRTPKIRKSVRFPREPLCPRRTVAPATFAGLRIRVINNPVLSAVGRLKESVVTGTIGMRRRQPCEHGLRLLCPRSRFEQIAASLGTEQSQTIMIGPTPARRINQEDLARMLENFRPFIHIHVPVIRQIAYFFPSDLASIIVCAGPLPSTDSSAEQCKCFARRPSCRASLTTARKACRLRFSKTVASMAHASDGSFNSPFIVQAPVSGSLAGFSSTQIRCVSFCPLSAAK